MKLYSRYISYVYLKYVFIVFIALECFYTGVDFLTNLDEVPKSANLALLYVGFTAISATAYVLPLTLIFAMILTFFNMIKTNELISFYSFGISKFAVIRPPFIISIVFSCFYIYLNTTPFAYAGEYKGNLENFNTIGRISSGMFLKYEDKYLYIEALNVTEKAASNIRLFYLEDGKIKKVATAPKAKYDDNKWTFYDENATILPLEFSLGGDGLKFESRDKFDDLYGFNPESIEKIYQSSNVYSINDAIEAIKTFKDQGVNVSGIKSNLYSLIFTPFFAPIMVLILFYYLPPTARFFNLAVLSFAFFISTVCIWGVLYVMQRFAVTAVISPEIGVVLPVAILGLYACRVVFRYR